MTCFSIEIRATRRGEAFQIQNCHFQPPSPRCAALSHRDDLTVTSSGLFSLGLRLKGAQNDTWQLSVFM